MAFTVAIVGLGRVGFTYDIENVTGASCLSHSQAFSMHKGFSLIAGIDPNRRNRDLFQKVFQVPSFSSISDLDRHMKHRVDVVVIATPPDTHLALLVEAAQRLSPRIVLVEKPATQDAATARAFELWPGSSAPEVVVNYPRRVTPGSILIKNEIGASGGWLDGSCLYTGDLQTQGIHMVDLCEFWFGQLESATVKGSHDPKSPTFTGSFERGTATFHSLTQRQRKTGENSLHVTSTDREWTFDMGGDRRVVSRSRQLPLGYSTNVPIGFEMYQFWVAQEIEDYLRSGSTNLATLRAGLRHVEIVESLSRKGEWP